LAEPLYEVVDESTRDASGSWVGDDKGTSGQSVVEPRCAHSRAPLALDEVIQPVRAWLLMKRPTLPS
jgi:hypothetical protein